jgi:sterol desaturase/sphingolipid hydroxylase (fatty acid hydroxylase superfamily)
MADSTIVPAEACTRLIVFAILLGLLILWERWAATRVIHISRARRWSTNFGIGLFDTLLLRFIFPAGAVGAALFATKQHTGFFHHVPVTGYQAIVASLLLLDLTIYLQHRLLHAVPWLWRIHRVHHADPEIDVSTALRFHPLESVLSMLLKTAVVICFGMPAIGVLLFEMILNSAAMFNHTNASLPYHLEPWARWIVVTPDMHRIHHSTNPADANRNFGFSVSWWDRLLGSYRRPLGTAFPKSIGLPDGKATPEHVRLIWLLLMPFRG